MSEVPSSGTTRRMRRAIADKANVCVGVKPIPAIGDPAYPLRVFLGAGAPRDSLEHEIVAVLDRCISPPPDRVLCLERSTTVGWDVGTSTSELIAYSYGQDIARFIRIAHDPETEIVCLITLSGRTLPTVRVIPRTAFSTYRGDLLVVPMAMTDTFVLKDPLEVNILRICVEGRDRDVVQINADGSFCPGRNHAEAYVALAAIVEKIGGQAAHDAAEHLSKLIWDAHKR